MTRPFDRPVRLATIATAIPPFRANQQEAQDFFVHHFGHCLSPRSLGILKKFLTHPSIKTRSFAIDGPGCLADESQDDKIARFTQWAVDLSAQASRDALDRTGLSPQEVSALVVNTCTGYLCPGLSSYLMERLELPRHIRTYDLVGSGCSGAIPNLQVGTEYLKAVGGGVALCIAVEICSATFQMADDLGLLLSNTLFSDGAAAAILWTRDEGLEVMGSSSWHQPEDREAIRYVHRNGQLYNQLSRSLPRIVNRAVAKAVAAVLAAQGLKLSDIAHWALHSGGERVIAAVAQALGLPEEKLIPTRETLARFGNLSSPSVLFTLDSILDNGVKPGDWCLMASFGAGLSVHALLFRAS